MRIRFTHIYFVLFSYRRIVVSTDIALCCFNGYCIIFVLHISVKRFEKNRVVKFMYKRGKKTRGVSLRKTEAKKSEYLFERARAPMRAHAGA